MTKISTILSIVVALFSAACGSTAVVAPITPAPLTNPVTDDVQIVDAGWTAMPRHTTIGHRPSVTAKAATSFTREAYIAASTPVSTTVASNE